MLREVGDEIGPGASMPGLQRQAARDEDTKKEGDLASSGVRRRNCAREGRADGVGRGWREGDSAGNQRGGVRVIGGLETDRTGLLPQKCVGRTSLGGIERAWVCSGLGGGFVRRLSFFFATLCCLP